MTDQYRMCAHCGSHNELGAANCAQCGQTLFSQQSEKRNIFTRRRVFLVGGACLAGLGIGAGVTFFALQKILSAQPGSQDAPTAVNGLAWSPNGKSIASYNGASHVQIWDATGKTLQKTFANATFTSPFGITQLAWSPDSSLLAVGTISMNDNGPGSNPVDGSLRILNVQTGALQHSLKLPLLDGAIDATSSYVAWSPDGRYIAVGDASTSGNIGLWSTRDWSTVPLKQLPGQYAELRSLGWSPDSQKLLLTYDTTSVTTNKILGMVLVWDVPGGQVVLTKQVGVGDGDGPALDSGKGVELNIGGGAWSSDGALFAVGLNQQTLIFNSAGQSRFQHGTFTNYGTAPVFAWSPTSAQRLAGQFAPDPAIYVWNPATNQVIQKYTQAAITTGTPFCWSPDGKSIASTDGNVVQVWPVE